MGSSTKAETKEPREEKKDKKDKKDKKRSESGGVHKAKKEDKKDKKERHAKLAAAIEDHLGGTTSPKAEPAEIAEAKEAKEAKPIKLRPAMVPGPLLPIAVPLADEKGTRKILRTIRKAAKHYALKRGVKEVTKVVRKLPLASPTNTSFSGVVILAGDIWPMDVISHLPVLCEDHNIPYIYLRSRAELGDAASTKRPTSVVMVMEKGAGPAKKKLKGEAGATPEREEKVKLDKKSQQEEDGDDDDGGFEDKYRSTVKLIQQEYARQAFW